MLSLCFHTLALATPVLVPFDSVPALHKRNPTDLGISNKGVNYVATISVGTPGQQVQVTIDTGSSDLWVTEGIFEASKSSTFNGSDTPFYLGYFDDTEAEGTWATDVVTIAGASLRDARFGYASFANRSSYLGIGMRGGEAPLLYPQQNGNATAPYDNIPILFRDQGIIRTATYSLWLNGPAAAGGSVLFGGIDTSKFVGDELTLLPMYNFYGTPIPEDFRVILSSLSLDSSLLATLSYSAALDSGSTAVSLPFPIVEALGNAVNYTLDEESGFFFGDCSNAHFFQNLEFSFLGANISVPLRSLISYAYEDSEGTVVATVDGKDQCMLGIQPAGGPEDVILGDFVLRYMYLTFDLENYEVGIAQAADAPGPSKIEEISGRIPGTPAPGYSDNTVRRGIQTYDVKPHSSAQSLPKRCAL